MEAAKIARGNYAFFYVGVGMALCGEDFQQIVRESIYASDNIAQFSICGAMYEGYIQVDSGDVVRNCSHGSLCDDQDLRDLLGKVARKIARSVKGEMNTDATVTGDGYMFDFKITKYERDKAHDFEIVGNPLLLPDDEILGRFVELKISMAQG